MPATNLLCLGRASSSLLRLALSALSRESSMEFARSSFALPAWLREPPRNLAIVTLPFRPSIAEHLLQAEPKQAPVACRHVEQPALVRLWGVEELVKKMMRGELTEEHRRIIELIQTVNDRGPAEVRGR